MPGWTWLWFPHRSHHHEEPTSPRDGDDARAALQAAEQSRNEALENSGRIRRLAEQLRAHRTENHFADLFRQSLRDEP